MDCSAEDYQAVIKLMSEYVPQEPVRDLLCVGHARLKTGSDADLPSVNSALPRLFLPSLALACKIQNRFKENQITSSRYWIS